MFVGHGSPMNAISDNRFTQEWAQVGQSFAPPSAILVVSAHWLSRGATFVTRDEQPRTIHDMSGFPEAIYQIQYPAPGDPQLANRLADQLSGELAGQVSGMPPRLTDRWGLDHGTWSVLVHLRPAADIPVLQLSINASLSFADHFSIARSLGKLRDEGVLILGSGNIVHNLRLRRPGAAPFDWAIEFDEKIAGNIQDGNYAAIAAIDRSDSLTRLAHPSLEHYLPLVYAVGAVRSDEAIHWFSEGFDKATLGMRSFISRA